MEKIRRAQLFCFDGDACDLMCAIFGREVCQVTGADSLEEALTKIKSKKFDLFILDGVYPSGEGIELCREIRETGTSAPIIFYSAAAMKNDRENAMQAGANEYLSKPDSWDALIEAVKGYLKTAEKSAG